MIYAASPRPVHPPKRCETLPLQVYCQVDCYVGSEGGAGRLKGPSILLGRPAWNVWGEHGVWGATAADDDDNAARGRNNDDEGPVDGPRGRDGGFGGARRH